MPKQNKPLEHFFIPHYWEEHKILALVCPVCGRCLHMEVDIPLKDRDLHYINSGNTDVNHPLPGGFSTIPDVDGIGMGEVKVE